MSYEVLARKLRPSGFAALVGQDHVVRALSHALDQDRLHHAYLFTGTRGVGKTTIARILAKSLNCEEGVSSTPCGQCSVCVEVRENRFIDLIEVDAASRTGVDDTRDLLENAQYMPTRGRFKVYLIDEVHMLSLASFNALLKTLEEPPPHVKFLLATTDPKKVPVTVLSRCLQFQLKNISAQTITDYIAGVLADESVTFETQAIEVIARSAKGSMRDALSLTDQAIAFGQGKLLQDDVITMLGVVGRDEITTLMEALKDGSAPLLLELTAELAERNADFADVLSGLMEALHNAAVTQATSVETGAFLADELQLYYQIALVGLRDLPIAPDPRSGFEMTMLRMSLFSPAAELPEPQIAASPQPTSALTHEAWIRLVPTLNLKGMSMALAKELVLKSHIQNSLHFILPPALKSLMTSSSKEAICASLSGYTIENINIELEECEQLSFHASEKKNKQAIESDLKTAMTQHPQTSALLNALRADIEALTVEANQ